MNRAKSNDVPQTIQANTHSNTPTRRGRIVQNVLIVWLDSNYDDKRDDCRNTVRQLCNIVNTINTFTDGQECIQFLQDTADEKIYIIISGALGKQIVPRVHNLSQVDSIFIFCGNKKYHEDWAKNWSKIKGVFTEIGSICEALKQTAQQHEQNAISISILSGSDVGAEKSGNRLDPSFMYTQIMKEILLTISYEQHHIDEFIQYSRELFAGNGTQLKHLDKLAHEYHQYTPIWWYTGETFLYSMLNRALRLMDVNMMIRMGFFITDLHHHIEQLHKEQFGGGSSKQPFAVYRGQGMDKDTFNKIVVNKGGLMSYNNFLSTSRNRDISIFFAEAASTDIQMVGILFVMDIDPARSSTSFACIEDVGYFSTEEEEVLFSTNTVFRIGEITPIGDHPNLVQIQLSLVSDHDNDLRQLIDYMRIETFSGSSGWYRMGLVLWKMGEHAKAQEVYEILLQEATDEITKGPIYHQLGVMKDEQGEYAEAIAYYEKSIEIEEKQIPHNDLGLARSYNNIGNVYFNMGDYLKALMSHEKALAIQQQSLSPTHPDLASSYNNIGGVYKNMGEYPRALSSYEKALAMRKQSLPPTHPDLASSYNNTGNVYFNMDDYPKALLFYEKALAIKQQSLPPTHPDLGSAYNNIGSVYKNMSEYSKALSFYERGLEIRQQSLPPTHPDLASSYGNMGLLYESVGDYSKAHSYFERAIDIAQRSLPANHPDLQKQRNNLARIKKKL